jgi:hypothetical protein
MTRFCVEVNDSAPESWFRLGEDVELTLSEALVLFELCLSQGLAVRIQEIDSKTGGLSLVAWGFPRVFVPSFEPNPKNVNLCRLCGKVFDAHLGEDCLCPS